MTYFLSTGYDDPWNPTVYLDNKHNLRKVIIGISSDEGPIIRNIFTDPFGTDKTKKKSAKPPINEDW